MEYWQGQMNWSLDKDWVCEVCGQNTGLEWGMLHAQCRCNNCHIQYSMRAQEGTVLTRPRCIVKEEYKEPLRQAWKKYRIPVDELPSESIDEFM